MKKSTTLGFVGCGDITRAIVTGLNTYAPHQYRIWVSPRGEKISQELAERFSNVSIGRDNQDVVEQAEIVFLAVRPQIATEVLRPLRFRQETCAVSLIAGYGVDKVRAVLRQAPADIVRAVPLLMVARAASQTITYPSDPRIAKIFEVIGGALGVESEAQFDTLLAISASMGLFFATAHAQCDWAAQKGVDYASARRYLMSLFNGLAQTALLDETPLDHLSKEYSTVGGINEQVVSLMAQAGTFTRIAQTYDQIEARIKGNPKGLTIDASRETPT
jgi:pyrroline-5-carboxylate reductase